MGFILHFSALVAVPPWLMMIFFPKWGPTRVIASSSGWALMLCVMYALFFVPLLPTLFPILALSNLENLSAAMGQTSAATMLWLHIQAFSLLVGTHIYQECQRQEISPWITSGILFATMVAGPVGYVAFRVAERLHAQRSAPSAEISPA